MSYLIGQILVFLLLAGILGFALGWLLGRLGAGGIEDELEAINEALAKEIEAARSENASCSTELSRLRSLLHDRDLAVSTVHDAPGNNRPRGLLSSPSGEKDNLRAIRGIGPVLERNMNNLGIFHFRQLSNFDPREVEWLADQVSTSPTRIASQRWIEQARELDRLSVE